MNSTLKSSLEKKKNLKEFMMFENFKDICNHWITLKFELLKLMLCDNSNIHADKTGLSKLSIRFKISSDIPFWYYNEFVGTDVPLRTTQHTIMFLSSSVIISFRACGLHLEKLPALILHIIINLLPVINFN